MKTQFSEKLTAKKDFQVSSEFATYQLYFDDYQLRKKAHDDEEDVKEKASEVSAVTLTLVRLSIKPSSRGARYTYRIMDGLPAKFQDPTTTALWGEEGTEREHSIFYSKQELGVTTTKNGIITPTPFKHLVHFIEDKVATYSNGDKNPTFGKFVPHFPTDDRDIEITKTLIKQNAVSDKIGAILGVNKNTVLVAGTLGEYRAKESERMRIAQLYASLGVKAPVEEETATA